MRNRMLERAELVKALQDFKKENGPKYQLSRLGYFGSYARGCARAESDIDVVFETDYPNLFRASSMKLELENLLERPVDLVRFRDDMDSRLKRRIFEEAIYV